MSDDFAFTPPSSDLNAPPVRRNENAITAEMVESLRGTRPWALFISVLGFLGAFLTSGMGLLVAGLGLIGGGVVGSQGSGEAGVAVAGVYGIMGLFYVVAGLIYGIPAWRLWQFCSAIETMNRGGRADAMAKALEMQRQFWKTVGLMIILSFVLVILMAIAMAAIGGFAALAAA